METEFFSSDDEMMLEENACEVINFNNDIINIESNDEDNEDFEDSIDDDSLLEDLQDSSQNEDAVYIFREHENSVFCCSLSKNGELAVTGGKDDMAYLWNVTTGEIIFKCIGHKDSVIFAEFDFSNTYVATADMSGIIKLWQIKNKTCVWETDLGHDITWMKWHNSGRILLLGLRNGDVQMLKVPENICKIFSQGYGSQIESGIIFPDGKRAAIGYQNGTIRIIDLKMGTVIFTISNNSSKYQTNPIIAIDCYKDNNLLIYTSWDGKTVLYTANTGKIVAELQNLNFDKMENIREIETSHVEVVAFCKDPTFPVVATGTIEEDTTGKIYIWDISKRILRHEISQEGGVTKLIWLSVPIFFTSGTDGILRCFDAKTGCCLKSFSGHKEAILELCISQDEKKALTVSDDKTARLFDISCIST